MLFASAKTPANNLILERRFNSAFIKISIIISKVDFLTPVKRGKDSALRSLIAEYYLP